MSKVTKVFFTLFWSVLLAGNSFAQNLEATIRINAEAATIRVSGRYLNRSAEAGQRGRLSFLKSGIGEPDLTRRVSNVVLSNAEGRSIPYKKLNPGEFEAEADFVAWSYETNVPVPTNSRAAAHVSWVSDKIGLVMLDDLLPQYPARTGNVTANVKIELPAGWRIISTERRMGVSAFAVADIEKAVFQIGSDLREIKVKNTVLSVGASGQWLFSDAELAAMADEIYAEYMRIFASHPAESVHLTITPFPQKNIQKGIWEAETRGRNVTIVSADMPFKTQSLQRLHEQLRHELFHLWLPNGVSLTGNYDWFYEGFALYQSLKTGVALNQIRFEDFLDTLSRAHNIDSMQTRRLSLLESSRNRWIGGDTQVYARGMVAAFLCDLALLQGSKAEVSVAFILRKLYESHRPPSPESDANTAILNLMARYPDLGDVTERFVKGPDVIDWQGKLESAGLENEPGNSRASLRVKKKLNARQKAVLDKLGYNSWRKLSRKS
ncbi:MAG: hypothetical protein ABIU09_05345 [Pyrinomonadaceae bacterium]